MVNRPDKTCGVAVAFQTPVHLQRFSFRDKGHLIDSSMTGFTTNALFHMNGVVEIDKVGQIMNSNPLKGLVILSAGPNWFQHRVVG